MIADTLVDELCETYRITAFEKEQCLDHVTRYELFDPYVHDYGPEDATLEDDSWMDEAA